MIDYLSDNLWQIWAVMAVLCLIVELSTGGFFIICFAVGSLAAMVASFLGGLYLQLGVFVAFSAISIFLVRPFALRYLHREESHRKSNADALIGAVGTVSSRIEAGGYGRVAIGGDDWKAESEGSVPIPVGTRVRVVGRESVIIKVIIDV